MAIKRCAPERGNILRNLANMADEACALESDDVLLELANDINMAIGASVTESENLFRRLVKNINAALGANASKRNSLLRNLVLEKSSRACAGQRCIRGDCGQTREERGTKGESSARARICAREFQHLAQDIERAIEEGAPASGNSLTNQGAKSLDGRYCDVGGETMDLGLAGSIGGIDVFAASDLQEPELLMKQKHNVLARFLDVLKPLVAVYAIPQTSVHIFADKEGRFISFNRGGNLFLNLRYFEAWHDNDVQKGNSGEALTFWYFMLAHGIAHNLVDTHDLRHEFYVSAICGTYLEPLIDRLS